ncbi:heterokaryon incompatibility protein-domain-containing protein, partial [Hyaloscypha finlandica]
MDTLTREPHRHRHHSIKNRLCHRCARWDFSKLFTGTVFDAKSTGPPKPKADVERYDIIGDLWDIRPFPKLLDSSSRCPVCNLVMELLCKGGDDRKDPDVELSELKIEYRKHGLNNWFMALRVKIAPWKREIPELRSEPTLEEEKGFLTILPGERFPRQNETNGPLLEYAGKIVSPYCDFTLINSWLKTCNENLLHFSCQKGRSGAATIKKLRFIDINNSCIQVTDVPQKYAALSYVWGAQIMPQMRLTLENFSELTTPQALKNSWSDVPTTVKDAMKVCENCNIPYLWVDALCVIQDGPDLQEELGQMTEIYSSAFVTIIAADGDSSWSGLRGISSPRDYKQGTAEFGQISLVEALPPFSVELDQSNWPHRAWTLQEHLFSKRCLMFLRNRMIFQCNLEWLDESIIARGIPMLTTLKAPQTAPRIRLYSNTNPAPKKSRKFLDFVEAYFCLDLTFDSDIMNACKGIMTWFERTKAMSFFWGTPTTDLVFNLSFLLKDCRRRENMPSWSWIGWRKNDATKEPQPIEF